MFKIKSQPNNTGAVGHLSWVAVVDGPTHRRLHDLAETRSIDLHTSVTFHRSRLAEQWTFTTPAPVYLDFHALDEVDVREILQECGIAIPTEVDLQAERPAWLHENIAWPPAPFTARSPLADAEGLSLAVMPECLGGWGRACALLRLDPRLAVTFGTDVDSNRAAWQAAISALRDHDALGIGHSKNVGVWEVLPADPEDYGDGDTPPPYDLEVNQLDTCGRHFSDLAHLLAERKSWIYRNGDCWDMALALHRQTGWPIHGAFGSEGSLDHVLVAHPDGGWLDVRGWCHAVPYAKVTRAVSWEEFTAASARPVTFVTEADGHARATWAEEWRRPFLAQTAAVAAVLFEDLYREPAAAPVIGDVAENTSYAITPGSAP